MLNEWNHNAMATINIKEADNNHFCMNSEVAISKISLKYQLDKGYDQQNLIYTY